MTQDSGSFLVKVALTESDWRRIVEILEAVCPPWGAESLRWQEETNKVILTAIQEVRAAISLPDDPSLDESDFEFKLPCSKCGQPMYQVGEDEHYYECSSCDHWMFLEPTNRERAEQGDWSWLEDWELNDRSDYY